MELIDKCGNFNVFEIPEGLFLCSNLEKYKEEHESEVKSGKRASYGPFYQGWSEEEGLFYYWEEVTDAMKFYSDKK